MVEGIDPGEAAADGGETTILADGAVVIVEPDGATIAVSPTSTADGSTGTTGVAASDGSVATSSEDATTTSSDDGGSEAAANDAATNGKPDAAIACGMQTCDSATQECCVDQTGASCVASGACTMGISLACTDPSACPSGDVCCFSGGMGGASATCTATCAGQASIELCSKDSDCSNGERCAQTQLGVRACRRGGGGNGGGMGGMGGMGGH